VRSEYANDQKLMSGVCGKDDRLFAAFFQRYSRLVFSIAFRVLRDRGEAEELVQEVFWHVYRNGRLYDPQRGAVRTWLLQITYGKAFNRREYLNARRFYSAGALDEHADRLTDGSTFEQCIHDKLRESALHLSFQALPEKQRVTLEMVLVDGCTLREVSTRTQESLGNTRHHYYRGLRNIKNVLGSDWPPESKKLENRVGNSRFWAKR
jgi:RNA polymerase sigma-70 factor, ECF subfamily